MAVRDVQEDSNFGEFVGRHIGPRADEVLQMCSALGSRSLDEFIGKVVPQSIRRETPLGLSRFSAALSESAALARLRSYAERNKQYRSYIGMGYYGCITPSVIQRNVLENPGWYTQYTPYQAEIAQGRLEALLNFQTMVSDLTALPVANASLLDEATAAAEALYVARSVALRARKSGPLTFFVAEQVHPQTIDVIRTRAAALQLEIQVGDPAAATLDDSCCGALVQYPDTYGAIEDFSEFFDRVHAAGGIAVCATDLLALTLLRSPGEMGADIAVGSSQRFGVPLGYGGPHAAFFAVKEELKRLIPGRIVGLSKDAQGEPALRLALQTREQHIRREKATSNICTAQVLLAVMASMYAVYHGPRGLRRIAERVHRAAARFAHALAGAGEGNEVQLRSEAFFDTVTFSTSPGHAARIVEMAERRAVNLRRIDDRTFAVAFDETVTDAEGEELAEICSGAAAAAASHAPGEAALAIPSELRRTSEYLTHPVFHRYHSETEMLRYIRSLETRDLSLGFSMIPLGSCTMKLNATSEMIPISWPEFAWIHPFAPKDQTLGYQEMCEDLERALCEMTGFHAVSLQPNAGSQGEFAGLLAIRGFHLAAGESQRSICLIPTSAHGTNPASAVLAGFEVVAVACDEQGNVDIDDMRSKVAQYGERLGALMITYPSTHGVFEENVRAICDMVRNAGGLVYVDGANLNALIGLCSLAELGADACHFNLHKTFSIPHGGGGPGVGPVGVSERLAPFLPDHCVVEVDRGGAGRSHGFGAVSAAPWGSAGVLPISWMYIAMMGSDGLTQASKIALLNANYIAHRIKDSFSVLYKGAQGCVAHECVVDLRPLKKSSGVEIEDVAKRLIDYGYHAPTVSWPVPGTMMIEPTESEGKRELDAFCDALISIRTEISRIESGEFEREDNPLRGAPHTAAMIAASEWPHPYSREEAVFPLPGVRTRKFWPAVARVDGSYGDRNLVCACPPVESY